MNPISALPQAVPHRLWPQADSLLVTVVSGGFCLVWAIRRGKLRGTVRAGFTNAIDARTVLFSVHGHWLQAERRSEGDTLMCAEEGQRLRLYRVRERLFFSGQLESASDSLLWDLRWEPLLQRDRTLIARAGGRLFLNGEEYLLPEKAGILCVQQAAFRRGDVHYAVLGPSGAEPFCAGGRLPEGTGVTLRGKKASALPPLPGTQGNPGGSSPDVSRLMIFKNIPVPFSVPLAGGRSLDTRFGRLAGSNDCLPADSLGFIISVN